MTSPYVLATLVLYAASLTFYVWILHSSAARRAGLGLAATVCLAGGLVLHYLALLDRSRHIHAVPYDDLFGSLSLFAWLLGATYLGLEFIHRHRSVGAFVLPLVLGVFVLAHAHAPGLLRQSPARGVIFAFHVTLNILAYAAFATSFVMSVIYLIQNRRLRGHNLSASAWRFPALEVLERMSRSSVLVGCISLVVGVTMGLIWAHRLWGRYWDGDPKVIITLLILAAYIGYEWLARTAAWRGARAATLCVVNFLFVIFSYSIVNLYLSRFHRYF